MTRPRRFLYLALFLLLIAGVGLCVYNYVFVQSAFTSQGGQFDFYIHDNDGLSEVLNALDDRYGLKAKSLTTFLARKMNYRDATIKPGLYELDSDMAIPDVIRFLRLGRQKPVNITFNNIRRLENLAGKITHGLELDSLAYLNYLRSLEDSFTVLTSYLPDTYQVYWNIDAGGLHRRMTQEAQKFWTNGSREKKAEALGLSLDEVYILASIVEQESTLESEKPLIASVYLNRLRRGMKLEADPTVVFAMGDFSIRRVLYEHLKMDSPYNTYKYSGLPPGPICMPSKSSIDAVLNAPSTGYIFFCAKPGYQNGHAFASTLSQHNLNAKNYRNWLGAEGIR